MADIRSFLPKGALAGKRGPVRALGIDLGTTNSTVAEATWDPASPEPVQVRCVPVAMATDDSVVTHVLVPSVVAEKGGAPVVGERAKRWRARIGEPGVQRDQGLFWECKNEIGTQRTYPRASEGFRSPKEIGAHVLRFLGEAALAGGAGPPARTVVTVPASFLPGHREDTLEAARLAGIDVKPGDLLDEPLAALLDHLFGSEAGGLDPASSPLNAVVLDFGGGTCDVAVFRLSPGGDARPVEVVSLAVSRYHRLGGGDVDRAIVHEVLVPALLETNGVRASDVGWEERTRRLEPALLSAAEQLKIDLSYEIGRLKAFGRWEGADRAAVRRKLPRVGATLKDGRVLRLESPCLSAALFEKLLEPFLDPDVLFPRETEYRLTSSIFAPLGDALLRAGLGEDAVDLCLLVGGSCLLPQVAEAVGRYFPKARILRDADPDRVQSAVARGAALHALALALTGRGLVTPVAGDSLSLRTTQGPLELIRRGAPLPVPGGEGWISNEMLAVPESRSEGALDLRVEVVDGNDRPVMKRHWEIPAPVRAGEPLILRYRIDVNQVLHVRLNLAREPEAPGFAQTRENPLTHVVCPNTARERVLELEEELRTGAVPAREQPGRVRRIADLSEELGQHEKALDLLKKIILRNGVPDPGVLVKMAIVSAAMRDHEREEKFYRQAIDPAKAIGWNGPGFNLALSFVNRGLTEPALDTVDAALAVQRDGSTLALRASIHERMGKLGARDADAKEALIVFGEPAGLQDWELGWFERVARMTGSKDRLEQVQAERKKRSGARREDGPETGLLPDVSYGPGAPN